MRKPEIQVIFKNYQRKLSPDRARAGAFLKSLWSRIGPEHSKSKSAEVTLVFLNDSQMRKYNHKYRNKDASTDVLSFPYDDLADGVHYLGDILISLERTSTQAQEKGHGFEKELRILMLHGVLHLLGYDHENDRGQMNRLENRLRRELHL